MKFLRSLVDDILEFLDEQPVWSLIYFSVFYFGLTLAVSRTKPFWYDELFTYHMSRLPDWETLIDGLRAGADLNPPPIYLLTRLSHSLFGAGEIATRLPAMIGFLLMLLCLYRLMSVQVGRPVAYAVMFFPLVTGAYRWAAEARTYGVVLGVVAAAAMFWQAESRSRRGSWRGNAGVFVCLTAAVTTQAYGVMSVGPFLLAEAVRYWRTREARPWTWAALLLPVAALAIYIPLLPAHNQIAVNNPVFRPEAASIPRFFHMLLDPAVFPLFLVLIAALWLARGDDAVAGRGDVPVEELALAVGFLLVPAAAVVVAMAVTRVFMDRYALSAILGATIMLGLLLARARNRRAPAIAAGVFCFWSVANVIAFPIGGGEAGSQSTEVKIEDLRPDLPLVISNGLLFLPLSYYEGTRLGERLTFLVDRKGAVKYSGSDVFDFGYPILKKWHGIAGQIEPYDQFLARGKPFLLLGPSTFPLDWVVKKLVDDGAAVRIIAVRPEGLVCEVTPKAKTP